MFFSELCNFPSLVYIHKLYPHCSYPPFCFQVGTTNRYIRVFLQSKFYGVPANSSLALDLLYLESKSPWRQMRANSTNCFIHLATLQVTQEVSFLLTRMCRSLMSPLLIVAVVLHSSACENINMQLKCNQMTCTGVENKLTS